MAEDINMEYCLASIKAISNNASLSGIIKKCYSDSLILLLDEEGDFKTNDFVEIKVKRKNKPMIIYEGMVSNIKDREVVIKNLRVLWIKENRSENRVLVKIPLGVTKIKDINGNIIDLSKPIHMEVKNLSTNGLLLESNLDIPENVCFLINMPIEDETMNIKTSTKRKYEEDGLYYYGCEFILEDEVNRNILDKFILKNYNNKFLKL